MEDENKMSKTSTPSENPKNGTWQLSHSATSLIELFSNTKVLLYIPAYNCEKTLEQVISQIPLESNMGIFILDNFSSDLTYDVASKLCQNFNSKIPMAIYRSHQNLGYAGSQKFAYSAFRDISNLNWICMIHGDGQYDPKLIERLKPYYNSNFDVVYGYRSRGESFEETPLLSYLIIKALSVVESIITGVYRKEWHSGFVMYATQFLRKINLEALTSTPHIDGNILYVSGLFKANVKPISIYKKYKELDAFEGAARRTYVFNVLKLMISFRFQNIKNYIRQ